MLVFSRCINSCCTRFRTYTALRDLGYQFSASVKFYLFYKLEFLCKLSILPFIVYSFFSLLFILLSYCKFCIYTYPVNPKHIYEFICIPYYVSLLYCKFCIYTYPQKILKFTMKHIRILKNLFQLDTTF